MNYPYYIIVRHEGRLPVPFEYRGTVIAKQFTSGRIGGSRSIEQTTTDKAEARRLYNLARMQDFNAEVYFIESPRKNRIRIREPQRELAQ